MKVLADVAKIWSTAVKGVKLFSWIYGLVFHLPLNVGSIFHSLYSDHSKYELGSIKGGQR